MFTRYAERSKWKVEVLDKNDTAVGGIKEITFMINGKGAYSRLKYESGVQSSKSSDTESSGRIHTSTITVAVLPEVDDIEKVQNQSKWSNYWYIQIKWCRRSAR